MSDFEPQDWLTDRLRAFGGQPVDSATQSQHLTAMAEAAVAPTLLGTLGSRLRIAAALGLGMLLGATGLTTAGALGPLQPIASDVVEAATPLDVPNGRGKSEAAHSEHGPGSNGKADAPGQQRVTEGCEAGISTRTRGHYLKGIREKYGAESAQLAAAKLTRCGMPLHSEGTPGADGDEGDAATNEADDADEPKNAEKGNKPDSPGKSDEEHGKPAEAGEAGGAGAAADTPADPPADTPAGPTLDQETGAPEDPDGDNGGGESDKMDPAGPPTSVPVGEPSSA